MNSNTFLRGLLAIFMAIALSIPSPAVYAGKRLSISCPRVMAPPIPWCPLGQGSASRATNVMKLAKAIETHDITRIQSKAGSYSSMT